MTAVRVRPSACWLFFLATLLSATLATAQAAAMGPDQAAVRWVDGRPMLRVTLRAGDRVYYCHLLLDLAAETPLFLHANAASSLRSRSTDVELGGIVLHDLGFEARRDTWLERLTAQFASELLQVPVAGILGYQPFAGRDLRLDGPRGLLELLPATAAGAPAPPSSPVLSVLPLLDSTRSGPRFQLELSDGLLATFAFATREPFCWLQPSLARRLGESEGTLRRAGREGTIDFALWAPFKPEVPRGCSGEAGLGGALLQQMVVTIQPRAGRVLLEHAAEPSFPSVEAALYRAIHGSSGTESLEQFLQQHGDAPEAKVAAQVLLERLREQGGSPAAMRLAGEAAIASAPPNGKATAALGVLETVPRGPEHAVARYAIAAAGLAAARDDEDGNAAHKLRLELGTLALQQGEDQEARRHLLAAVFGMPTSGPANLQLGRWHERQGQLEQAMGRYFLAMLDMRETGQEGLAAFSTVFRRLRGESGDLLAELQDLADGRVPSFHPLPRAPGSFDKTGRTVLVELFTGAMCPPCVAADVACDALSRHYDPDEVVLLQWHLPIPAPEPMVSPASLDRGERYGVRGTPTVVIAGGEPVVGGGRADAAPELFQRYRDLVEAELKHAPVVQLDLDARLDGDRVVFAAGARWSAAATGGKVRLHVVLTEDLIAFPGRNGVLFHHHVVRAQLTPVDGIEFEPTAGPHRGEAGLAQLRAALDTQVAAFETAEPFLIRPVVPDPQRLTLVCFAADARSGKVLQAKAVALAAEQQR